MNQHIHWKLEDLPDGLQEKVIGVAKNLVKSKNRAIKTIVNGILYHSKKEAKFAMNLELLKQTGNIKFYLRQIGFDLPGHSRHFIDFLVFYNDGTYKFIEVKGRDLPMGKLKRKQVEELYKIKIEIV
jgi:hypothetical protein